MTETPGGSESAGEALARRDPGSPHRAHLPSGPEQRAKPGPDEVICSARACGRPATWAVVWNNPRIHTPDREKVWTACDQHRDQLSEYLRVRGMLRRVDPLSEHTTGTVPTE